MAQQNGIPILDETNLRVGQLFSIYMPMNIQGIPVNRTLGPLMLLNINWETRFALLVSLDTGRFLEVPIRYLIRFNGPLMNRQQVNRRSFFERQTVVIVDSPGTHIQPPLHHGMVYEVLAIEDDRRAAQARQPDIPRYIHRENYLGSHFADLFLF